VRTQIFHSFPSWQLSGVNTWSVNLATASRSDPDFEHVMLITGVPAGPVPELDALDVNYIHLPVASRRKRRDEWRALKSFLEAAAPCIYIPNYDFHRSCAIGAVSPQVRVCAVIHSDEDCYYDEVKRLGSCFDAIVTVSSLLQRSLKDRHPELGDRMQWIAHGVPSSGKRQKNSVRSDKTLQLFYCNRISQYQKRVFDLPETCCELVRLGVDFTLTVAGAGPDEHELKSRFARAGVGDKVRQVGRLSSEHVREAFMDSDIFLLTSDFEGLPISLLEAMSAGCVPVAYEIESGVRDAVEDGLNGILTKHGDPLALAEAIRRLDTDRSFLSRLSLAAVQTHEEKFSVRRMADDYRLLFARLMSETRSNAVRDGRIRLPSDLTLCYRVLRRFGLVPH
jgi:glycosyltransferase involved in cell wall biosynthesis